jgi:hypothetical protein
LADYDGFVAGLLLSDTPKSKLPKPDIELLARMESALGRFPASNEIRLYITYMKKIAEVLELAQMTTAVYPAKPLWARTLDRLKFR